MEWQQVIRPQRDWRTGARDKQNLSKKRERQKICVSASNIRKEAIKIFNDGMQPDKCEF